MTPEERVKRRKLILDTYARLGRIRPTARTLHISIHVVRRVLRGLDGPVEAPRRRPPRPSKLDPFKPVVQRLVLEDGLTAVLALEEVRALGYQGSYSVLKQYVRRIRPAPRKRPTTRLEHPPGAEGQVDWSSYRVRLGGDEVEVQAFSLVLPFSRWMFVRFRLDQTLPTLIELHEEAFEELGGVPALMTYDNMTTVGRHIGPDEIELNARFDAWRADYDFDVHLITPYRPNEHAPVERPFHYLEHNCLLRRRHRFASLDALNEHAEWWLREIANVRDHGTTRERPVDRLQRERLYLQPLPRHRRHEPCKTLSRTVQTDFCVAVDTNRYSVSPRHLGKPATVLLFADRLEILIDGEVAARHELCQQRHQRRTLPEHEDEFKRSTPSRRLLEQAFIRLGPVATTYYEGLRAQRGRGAGYHMQRILKLCDRYGSEAVCGAMAHAARFGSYGAEPVARVLSGRELPRQQARSDLPPASPPPAEQVRRWLEAIHVEDSDLDDYDRLIDERGGGGEEGDDNTKEEGDDDE